MRRRCTATEPNGRESRSRRASGLPRVGGMERSAWRPWRQEGRRRWNPGRKTVGNTGIRAEVHHRSRVTMPALCIALTDNGAACGRPAAVWDAYCGGLVCEAHAPATEPYRRAVTREMERRDRAARVRFLIGARVE